MYVHIPGGVDETPVEMTISASPGDAVKVRVANGRAWVTGNQTAPPTDDTEAILAKLKAIQAEKKAQTATESAEIAAQAAADATTSAGIAGRAASVAQAAAEAAQATADSKKVVFTSQPTPPYHVGDLWVSGNIVIDTMSDGTNDLVTSEEELFEALMKGDGQVVVYYCIYARAEGESFDESDWSLAATDDTTVNELREWFWHDSTGAHILGDETGYRNDLNSTGMHIVDTSTETEVARFAADGAQIGADEASYLLVEADCMKSVVDGRVVMEFNSSNTEITAYKRYTGDKKASTSSELIWEIDTTANPDFTKASEITLAVYAGVTGGRWFAISARFTHGTAQTRPLAVATSFACNVVYDGANTFEITGFSPMVSNPMDEIYITARYAITAPAPYAILGSASADDFGSYSVSEGLDSVASGNYAHAQNQGTLAASTAQTALGKYNVSDASDTYAVIVGKGTSDTARSNAATLDWFGNVSIAGGLKANADSEVTGDISATGDVTAGGNISATGNITAGGDATITGDLSANSVTTGSDIDWTELTLDSASVAYSSVTTPHYKRRGDMVTVIGDVKPSAAVAAQGTLTIGQLPAECCPPQRISLLCQGSTTAVWYMQIATDGTITAARYRTEAGYQAMNTNTWLPFSITYMV